jgi:hypothetical protein
MIISDLPEPEYRAIPQKQGQSFYDVHRAPPLQKNKKFPACLGFFVFNRQIQVQAERFMRRGDESAILSKVGRF